MAESLFHINVNTAFSGIRDEAPLAPTKKMSEEDMLFVKTTKMPLMFLLVFTHTIERFFTGPTKDALAKEYL